MATTKPHITCSCSWCCHIVSCARAIGLRGNVYCGHTSFVIMDYWGNGPVCVLSIERKDNRVGIIGGTMDDGDRGCALRAACRETEEETGYVLNPADIIDVVFSREHE